MPKNQLMRGFMAGIIVAIYLTIEPVTGFAYGQKDFPPRPLPLLEEDCTKFSTVELERLLGQLKSERSGLDSEWKSLSKRRGLPKTFSDQDEQHLQLQLKKALRLIQQSQRELKPINDPLQPPNASKTDDAEPIVETPKSKNAADKSNVKPPVETKHHWRADPLLLAQALFRSERYAEALTAFRLVDLKGKKAEERVPIQFLIASCLLHSGKNEEAAALLRETANSRGDERFAGYAQWQLEVMRWQREVDDRLQNIRQRRQTTEKLP